MKIRHLKVRWNGVEPENGKFLIAEPFLKGDCFQRSVIFLIEHNEGGTMGFVINKEEGVFDSDNLFDFSGEAGELPLYCGGPLGKSDLFFLHCLGEVIPGSVHIVDDIYFGGDIKAALEYIATGFSCEGAIKFFLGYSGWEAGQLKDELEQNSWLVAPVSREQLFRSNETAIWSDALKLLGPNYSLWDKYPLEPGLN